jgi:hypothetical protein
MVGLDKPGALRTAWPSLTISQRRDTVATLIGAVVVGPAVVGRNYFDRERVSIRWRA